MYGGLTLMSRVVEGLRVSPSYPTDSVQRNSKVAIKVAILPSGEDLLSCNGLDVNLPIRAARISPGANYENSRP